VALEDIQVVEGRRVRVVVGLDARKMNVRSLLHLGISILVKMRGLGLTAVRLAVRGKAEATNLLLEKQLNDKERVQATL
jgi:hypothetical protein